MTIFSSEVRKYLEWSHNYNIAEMMHDDTTRHNAQWIAAGIERGEDLSDGDLINCWLDSRVDDLNTLGLIEPAEWTPDDWVNIKKEIQTHPEFEGQLADVRKKREGE